MALPQVQDAPRVPPLNAGDQLSLEEFQRLSDAHPEIKKAELIDGTVFLEMSVGPLHARFHKAILTLVGVYESRNPGVEALDNGSVLILGSEVQPDVSLRRVAGGSSAESPQRIEGPPELVIEVSASSFAYDSTLKRALYERAGVLECLLIQVHERRIQWWTRTGAAYTTIEPRDGIYESRAFPGLRLDAEALWTGDIARVLAGLDN